MKLPLASLFVSLTVQPEYLGNLFANESDPNMIEASLNARNSLGWQIHDHLKKYRPKMFQALKRQHGSSETCRRRQKE